MRQVLTIMWTIIMLIGATPNVIEEGIGAFLLCLIFWAIGLKIIGIVCSIGDVVFAPVRWVLEDRDEDEE